MNDWMDDIEVFGFTSGVLLVEEKQLGAESGRGRVDTGRISAACIREGPRRAKRSQARTTRKLELVKAIYSPVVEFNLRMRRTASCSVTDLRGPRVANAGWDGADEGRVARIERALVMKQVFARTRQAWVGWKEPG
jgi:hypothetical protein